MKVFPMRFKKTILGVAGLMVAAAATVVQPAAAQTLSEVLNRVRADSQQLNAENQQRLQRFQAERNEQSARLSQLRNDVAGAESRGRALAARFDANEVRLSQLQEQLETEAGDFGELLGQFRQAAGEIQPLIRGSIISTELPGRAEAISAVAEARRLPSREELDILWKTMLGEMIAQGEVKSYTAEIANLAEDGASVFRIGPFMVSTAEGSPKFLQVNQQGRLAELERQPAGSITGPMGSVVNAAEGAVVRAPIDPTRGSLLSLLSGTPDLGQRIEQGGLPGYVIIVLLIIGMLIGVFKLVSLFLTSTAVSGTAKSRKAGAGNPLARLFKVYEDHKNSDLEALELKLDEQILKEVPRIERFNNILKVLAAVAPLLGLLGTVVGMIRTFTQITLVGTGDPRLMADGISQALVTTVQGLVAAIPLLLIHALCSSSSRSVQQTLEEQAAGMIAERAERDRATA